MLTGASLPIRKELSARPVLIEHCLQIVPIAGVIALIASLKQVVDELDGLRSIRPPYFRRWLIIRIFAECGHDSADMVDYK